MRPLLPYLIFVLLLLSKAAILQTLPITADAAIHVIVVMEVKPKAVWMARCPVNNAIYYATADGNLYKIRNMAGVFSDWLANSSANHNDDI